MKPWKKVATAVRRGAKRTDPTREQPPDAATPEPPPVPAEAPAGGDLEAAPPEPAAAAEPASEAEPVPAPPVRPPGTDAEVAADILAVLDLLTSPELRRRLTEAAGKLPDAEVIAPEPGTAFDAERHQWEVSHPPPEDGGRPETIAEVISPGLADHTGHVLRYARVAVYQHKD